MSIEEKIKEQIKNNSILLYMKGSPYEPKCGFSAKTVQALIDCGAEFSYVDILDNQEIRQTLPNISDIEALMHIASIKSDEGSSQLIRIEESLLTSIFCFS